MPVHKMAETESEEVEFPVCHLVARELNIRLQHLIFISYISVGKEDCIILRICWVVGL